MPARIYRTNDIRDARRGLRRRLLVHDADLEPIEAIVRFFDGRDDPKTDRFIQYVLDALESAHYELVPVYTSALVKLCGGKWGRLKTLADKLAAERLSQVTEADHPTFYPVETAIEEDE